MKRTLQFIISTSAALILAHSTLAQDGFDLKANAPDDARVRVPHARRPNHLSQAAKVSDVIGTTVKNYLDEKLGKVKDIAVDLESGRIVLVILSTGGFIGMGDKVAAVPPQIFYNDVVYKALRLLDTDKEKLKGAPKFELSKWAECCDSNHLAAAYEYYDEEPVLNFIRGEDEVVDGLPVTTLRGQPDGASRKDGVSSDGPSIIPVSRLKQIQRSSKLMGMPVINLQNEKVGRVQNILVDLPSGRIVAVIISSGEFIGKNDELSAVPPMSLHFTANRDTLLLDASKAMLSDAPHFQAGQWPDFRQPAYAGFVYQAFNMEPYFATNVTTEADNRWRNIRDHNNRTLTPLTQGNSQADLNITGQIRKAINAANKMSVDAKSVEIITIEGWVTLRGIVDSAEEKNLIGSIAERIARSENVDNQLEVKLTASNNN
jgi:sporulation protein YlmC with PRC-barrel domain